LKVSQKQQTPEESQAAKIMIEKSGDVTATNSADSDTFVDYVPPPEVKILPPAKYKLWLIVFVLVYFSSWVAYEAEFLHFLHFDGWLSPNAAFFLSLAIIVFVLVYSTLDLFIACLSFKTKDNEVHGVDAWLKQPRAQWMYSHENLLLEILARVIHILEEGFGMLNAPPLSSSKKHEKSPRQFDCANHECHRSLRIEHRIKPDKIEDYKKWTGRVRHAVDQQNGLLVSDSTRIRTEEFDEELGAASSTVGMDNASSHASTKEGKDAPHLHVINLKFANIDYLNDWMLSPRRKALMKALRPMLVEPDVVQIQSSRALPDAFSDLLTRQGSAVPKSPPKKWKVWWLTLVALYITQQWTISFLPYYYDQWGITEYGDHRLVRLVQVFITTFLNSYVMTPLFLFVFDHWLHHHDVERKNTRQPWKILDEGFSSFWPKVLLALALYGGCLVAILVKRHAGLR